ncbi:MAG: glycosyltransferase family 4 protein [Anaerolineales bacterium]
MSPPRICVAYLAGFLGLGGSEHQLYNLASGLDRTKFKPIIFTLNPYSGDYWERRLKKARVSIVEIPKGNQLRRAWMVQRAIRQSGADIVHSFHYFANGYAAIAGWQRRLRVIGNVRFWPSRVRLARVGHKPWRLTCLYGVDLLLCNTRSARRALQDKYRRLPHISVIPNGTLTHSDSQLAQWRAESSLELGKADGHLMIGFVGRLDDNKNPLLMLQAVKDLAIDYPHVRLVIVGDGPLRSALVTEVLELGLQDRIRILGARPKANELMPAFDILCLPSRSEGAPNVLMEASAAGLPVIATDVGGVTEIVSHGKTGFLVPEGDLKAFRDRLQQLLTDPLLRQQMGLAGRRRMQLEFSIPRMVQHHEQLYRSILKYSVSAS